MQITDQTVLITGGSRGIGLALAKRFIEAGNRVIITGRNPKSLAEAQAQLPGVEVAQADMMNLADLQRLHASYPDVSILINNAGVQYNYTLADVNGEFDRIETEIATNFLGLVQLTALYLPTLLTHQESAIVNISSGLGYVPKQSAPIYSATKSAVHTFSQSLRWQTEKTPVRVFEMIPSLVETDMTAGRGHNKITADALVDEFWTAFQRDQPQIAIGKVKSLLRLNRWFPSMAQRITRYS